MTHLKLGTRRGSMGAPVRASLCGRGAERRGETGVSVGVKTLRTQANRLLIAAAIAAAACLLTLSAPAEAQEKKTHPYMFFRKGELNDLRARFRKRCPRES